METNPANAVEVAVVLIYWEAVWVTVWEMDEVLSIKI